MERRILQLFSSLSKRVHLSTYVPNNEGHYPIYLLLLMSSPTPAQRRRVERDNNNLAIVAEMVNHHFIAEENVALTQQNQIQSALYRDLLEQFNRVQQRVYAQERRIAELEFDLRDTLDHNERLVQLCYNLETSILECPDHPGRDIIFNVPPPVMREIDFQEVYDLTSDSDATVEDDREL